MAYLIAEKVAQILEESFDLKYNTLEIPDLNMDNSFNINLDSHILQEPTSIIDGVNIKHQIKRTEKVEKMFKF